ncbi:hypothetical protein EVU96_08560 [Bacillus infantis]|uniref:hypothetical protein n=1 Tax=Bacillus infantis TaxID=324767 RepID=UPI00101D7498|nr:hypothetical protein [Bacillus infantis]RYI30454.1 hypothetical protein EVU96_08560 [Bacillus infantis]
MHVCLECYDSFDKRFLSPVDYEEYVCPKNSCQGDIVELDELIAPTIILLNQKGYITKFCCSGHWYDSHIAPYIYFYEDCEPESIPNSFTWDKWDTDKEKPTIRASYDENTGESRYDFVTRVNKELYEWAISLPYSER